MPGARIVTPMGMAFIDGPGARACRHCHAIVVALCDYPLGNGRTCDMPVCGQHACVQGRWEDNHDYCPAHHLAVTFAPAVPRMSRDRERLCQAAAEEAVKAVGRPPMDEHTRIYSAAYERAERESRPATEADGQTQPGYLF